MCSLNTYCYLWSCCKATNPGLQLRSTLQPFISPSVCGSTSGQDLWCFHFWSRQSHESDGTALPWVELCVYWCIMSWETRTVLSEPSESSSVFQSDLIWLQYAVLYFHATKILNPSPRHYYSRDRKPRPLPANNLFLYRNSIVALSSFFFFLFFMESPASISPFPQPLLHQLSPCPLSKSTNLLWGRPCLLLSD